MPTEFTEEEKQEIIKRAPKATFVIVDSDGMGVIDADSKSFAKEVCGEGELTVGYIREDLVFELFGSLSHFLPEGLRTEVREALQHAIEEEPSEEEVPLAVPVPDSTTVL